MSVDIRQLDQWADVLRAAGEDALSSGEKVVSKGALNIKTEARENAPHGPHTPHYRNSINYDIKREDDAVEAEIGPDKNKRQGPLGNIFEYGTIDTPPKPHLEPALDHEEDRFYEACEQLAVDLVARHG